MLQPASQRGGDGGGAGAGERSGHWTRGLCRHLVGEFQLLVTAANTVFSTMCKRRSQLLGLVWTWVFET